MFEAGVLEQLNILPVEVVAPVNSSTQDAQKDSLIQVLRLSCRGVNLNLARTLSLDLELSGTDFCGANLRDINLSGVDLTGADLTYADVTGTIFGDNPGLSEADKCNLQSRGAIFLDPPG